jgi:threonine synthase
MPSPDTKATLAERSWDMWRYREWMPLEHEEEPVTLGEGGTPLLDLPLLADQEGVGRVFVKDESQNPTGSFKARGLSAAVTRAAPHVSAFTTPTAGNAGVALAAYGRRAGLPVKVFAPATTPPRILAQIERFGADLELLEGHIGDCGKASRSYAADTGAFDMSTLREPYRIEGKKTLGLEIAEQLGWTMPHAIIYPTGGGTGLIGMWIAFRNLLEAGWVSGTVPRLYSVQSTGCAPVVRAVETGAKATQPWTDPQTVASGLRVPGPLGGRLILRAIAETGGDAVAVDDDDLQAAQIELTSQFGIDAGPEGGATLSALRKLRVDERIRADEIVVLFNTGAGWLYERP